MFIELLIAILLGCMAGIITGIIPGLHINLVATILFSLSSYFLGFFNVVTLVVFIISMSVTHTFTDFISAIYLGAPADDTALSVLPGHRMLLKGMGHEAIKLTVIGSFFGLVFTIILSPLFLVVVPLIFNNLTKYIGWILLTVSLFMILRDKDLNKKFWNFYIFMLSGILGLIVLNSPINEPLLPMLSGLFGVSMLVVSLSEKTVLPKQRTTEMINLRFGASAKALISGIFSGSLVSIFPALGPAQAAIIALQFFKNIGNTAFLILIGSINTVSMILSLITLFTISKARNGSIVIVQKLVGNLDLSVFILFLITALIAGCIAAILTLYASKIFSNLINKINYNAISIAVIIFISLLVYYFSGFIGFFILAVATFIGLIPTLTKTNKSHLMGCLLVPVIIWYLV